MILRDLLLRVVLAVSLVISAASHSYLYVHGYQHIPGIGDGFLVQASVSFALAVLIPVGGPFWLRWAAAAVAGGSLVAFVLSRTVGLMGFTEHGWEPSPYAAASVIAEAVTVLTALVWVAWRRPAAVSPAGRLAKVK